MAEGPRKAAVTAVGLALVIAVAVAATAFAGRGSTQSRSATLTGDGPASAAAKCPVGTRATGAGFAVKDAFNPKTDTGAASMIQSLDRSSTRLFSGVFSMQRQNQPATTVSTFVRCITSTRGPTAYSQGTATINPGVISVANARCTGDFKAVGGGFRATPAFTPPTGGKGIPIILESRRAGPKTWRTTLLNPNPFAQAPVEFSYFALCEPAGNPATKTVKKTVVLPPDRRRDVGVKCPRGWHTASGGFRLGPIADEDIMFALADRSRPAGSRGWRAGAWSPPEAVEPEGGTLTVYAYCKRN